MNVLDIGAQIWADSSLEDRESYKTTLSSWSRINQILPKLDAKTASVLIYAEAKSKNREAVLARLVSRRIQLLKNADYLALGFDLPKRAKLALSKNPNHVGA